MWHDIDDQILPVGVVSTDIRCSRVIFGAKTVRAWNLKQFQTAAVKTNGVPGLVAFQLYVDGRGSRKVSYAGTGKSTLAIACGGALHIAKPRTRYLASRQKGGFIVIDFSQPAPVGWRPQAQRRRDEKRD